MQRSVKVQGNSARDKEVGSMSYRRVSRIALVVLTAMLLACGTDQAVSPTAPDLGGASLTAEKKGGGGGKAQSVHYSMTATGFLETNPILFPPVYPATYGDPGVSNATKEGETHVVLLGVPLIGDIFDPAVNLAASPDWESCFSLQLSAPPISSVVQGASLSLFRTNENGTATLRHGMQAFGIDGDTEFGYRLDLFGGSFSRPDPWTPFPTEDLPIGATTLVTFAAGTAEWELRVSTKPKGKSTTTACTGSGTLPFDVIFTVTSITDPF